MDKFKIERQKADQLGLKIGTRIYTCSEILSRHFPWPTNKSLSHFLENLDFVGCYTESLTQDKILLGPVGVVQKIGIQFLMEMEGIRRVNASISITFEVAY